MTILADIPISKSLSSKRDPFWDHYFETYFPEEDGSHSLAPSDRDITQLIHANKLVIEPQPEDNQIQPASLELRIGTEVWVTDVSLPRLDAGLLKKHTKEHRRDLSVGEEILCEVGKTYILRSYERISLPSHLEGITDTKSTVGRLGTLCYAASEKYAHLNSGFQFEDPKHLLFVVEPYAFPIILKVGKTRTFQIRFRETGTSYLNPHQVKGYYGNEVGLFSDRKLIPYPDVREEDGVKLSMQTERVFAQRKQEVEPIDLTKLDHYNAEDYFEEIGDSEEIVMDSNRLYLFGTKEEVALRSLSGWLTREGPYLGHGFSTHFAGFVDPGFNGQITLECWSYKNRVIPNGQYSGRILLEELTTDVKRSYGDKELGSSYQGQTAPRLPKVFKTK
jgi:dCTP deaminase